MQPTKAKGLKLEQFYGLEKANEWLRKNPEATVHDIEYAANPTDVGSGKHSIILAYKAESVDSINADAMGLLQNLKWIAICAGRLIKENRIEIPNDKSFEEHLEFLAINFSQTGDEYYEEIDQYAERYLLERWSIQKGL